MDVLGIDISKADFHACLIQGSKRSVKSFPNAPAGYRQVQAWLKNRRCNDVHACMESTGLYWMGLAKAFYDAGVLVSVENPARIKFFSRSQLRRTKTDAVDAEVIADYCRQCEPQAWTPPPEEILNLRALLTYRDHLVRERVRLNQVASQIPASSELRRLHARAIKTLRSTTAALEKEMRALLKTHSWLGRLEKELRKTKGFGPLTACSIVARLPFDRLRNAKAAAAFAGLSPHEWSSGTSINGRPRICKIGDPDLRSSLYMAAMAAMRSNHILKPFADRLRERGKEERVIIVAVMRKLLVHAYSVLRRLHQGQPVAA
jgi:transposase